MFFSGCGHYPTKTIFVDKIVEVPVFVEVPGPTVYITPSELERDKIDYPVLQGVKWSDLLVLVANYNESLNSCNARIDRIWLSVEGFNDVE